MNKTEIKKAKVKAGLTFLEQNFGAIADAGGGSNYYIVLTSNGEQFTGQFSRRDFTVTLNDSIGLSGPGWSKEEIAHQAAAVQLEDDINEELEALMEDVESQAFMLTIDEAMGFRPNALNS